MAELPVVPVANNGQSLTDDHLLIAMGAYPGLVEYNKFGTNLTLTDSYAPIWIQTGVHTPLAAATKVEVASDSADDDAGGDGATSVLIFGLDADYLEQQEVVVMNGTTEVLSGLIYTHINRVIVVSTGVTKTNAGNIYVADDSTAWGGVTAGVPTTLSAIQAKITTGNSQTQQCIYTIPANKTAYMTDYYVSGGGNKLISFQFKNTDNLRGGIVRTVGEGELVNATAVREFRPYIGIPGKFTVWLAAKVSTGNAVASGGFNLILVDNDRKNL